MTSKTKTKSLLLATSVFAVTGLFWWLLPSGQDQAGLWPEPSPGGIEAKAPAGQANPIPDSNTQQRVAIRRSAPTNKTPPVSTHEEPLVAAEQAGASFRAEDYSKSRMQIYFEFQRAVRTWTPEIFDQKTQQQGVLTGEEIYEAYVYLRSCLDSLRSVDAFQQRKQAMEEARQRHPEQFPLDELQQTMDRFSTELARCEGVGENLDGQLELLLVDWLGLAAERGYPQAQIAYHQSIRWLLTRQRMTVYRDPLIVHRYRERAPAYLQAAIRTGHSEAFVEYSLAMQEGILYEQDDELAYAYARAADLAANGENDMATLYLAILEKVLDPGQLTAGRKQGRELCDRWCL